MDDNRDKTNKQNGIFSTPDLSVDAQKIATPSTLESTKNRIASIFANTDATKQSQQLTNSLNVPAQDVIIPSQKGATANFRNKALIAVVVVISIIGIGLVTWLIINNTRHDDALTESPEIEKVEEQFNQFATYVLFGESRNVFNESYDSSYNYKLSEEYAKEPMDMSYWDESTSLLDLVITTYEKIGDTEQYESPLNALQSYRSKFKFLKNYRTLGDITESQLVSSYLTGIDAARTYVENRYEPLLDADFYDGQELANQKINYYNIYLDYIQASDKNGCIKDGQITQECTSEGVNAGDVNDYLKLLSDMNVSNNTVNSIALDIVDDLETQCWAIRDTFANRDNESSQNDSEEVTDEEI